MIKCRAAQSTNSYQEIRNPVGISLPYLGFSPVLLCDKIDILAGLPEEEALAEQGPQAAARLFYSAERVPRQALI